MAYYDQYRKDNRGKGSFAEPAERRYAKTNRYSEEKRGFQGEARFHKDSRPVQQGKKPYGKPALEGAGERRFGKPAFERSNEKRFGNPASERHEEKRFGKPAFERHEERRFGQPFAKPQGESVRPGRSFGRPAAPVLPVRETMATDDAAQAAQGDDLLFGRNPIREALKSGRDIEKMMVSEGDLSGSAREILSMARKANIKIQMVEKSVLDRMARNHQGMIAFASAYQYAQVEDMLRLAAERNEKPFLVVLDQITDPHNLGAVIRTAACCGVHGVIIPRHRAVGLTSAAVKTSAGAVEYVKVARVTNIAQALKQLKEQGIWSYAADMQGRDYRTVDFSGGAALVIGSEGEGVSNVVRSQCDETVSIPMAGEISSLNASVAAGILMHAIYCGRNV